MPATILTAKKAIIGANSLKALLIGSQTIEKSYLMAQLDQKFGLTYPILPTDYDFDRYLEMLNWLRQQLYPTDSVNLGFEKLGRNVTQGFFQGPVGQVLKMSIRVMGPQKSVPYFFRISGGALKFGRFEIVQQRPQYVNAVLYNVPGSPDIMRGMSLESMEMAQIKNPKVVAYKISELDTEFVVTWEV